jgi:hypothetical protein
MSVTKAQLIGNVSGGAVFSGNVGIGTTTSPTTALDVNGDVTIADKIIHGGDTNTAIRFPAADTFTVETAGSERGRIDSSGRILVGTSTARDIEPYGLGGDGQTAHTYEDVGDTSPGPGIALGSSSSTDRFGPYLYLFRSRGGSVGSNTSVSSGDNLGTISFAGADGTDVRTRGAAIYCEVDGAVGINSMPGRLVFSTTADGASSPTERMRIDNGGNTSLQTVSAYLRMKSASTNFDISAQTGATDFIRINANGTQRFQFDGAGRAYNSTGTWGTISDLRLKENIDDASSKIEEVKSLRVVNYNLLSDPGVKQIGFIAQEIEEVFPSLVEETGTVDGVENVKAVKTTVLIPVLVKALQEAIAKIEVLEQRLNDAGIN